MSRTRRSEPPRRYRVAMWTTCGRPEADSTVPLTDLSDARRLQDQSNGGWRRPTPIHRQTTDDRGGGGADHAYRVVTCLRHPHERDARASGSAVGGYEVVQDPFCDTNIAASRRE